MKKILLIILLAFSTHAPWLVLADGETKIVISSTNRVALLELYTSEGCSSCPPADRFLSRLKNSGISSEQLIPMALHVTYWDYIGWKDPFAKKQYDQRQRDLAHKNAKDTVYTPQFILVGDDYRRYSTFSEDIRQLVSKKSTVDLTLSAQGLIESKQNEKIVLSLRSDISRSKVKEVSFYFVITENNLSSNVNSGENEGEKLHHDYVVRQLSAPYFQSQPDNEQVIEHIITLQPEWKKQDLSIVAFAENPHTGEILQAVRMAY